MFLKHRPARGRLTDRCSSERVSAYLDGELSPADQLDARRHLAHCPRCQETQADYLQIRQVLRAQPDAALPPGVRRRIADGLARPSQVPVRADWRPGFALASAAALLLLIVGAALAAPQSRNVPVLAGLAPAPESRLGAPVEPSAPAEQAGSPTDPTTAGQATPGAPDRGVRPAADADASPTGSPARQPSQQGASSAHLDRDERAAPGARATATGGSAESDQTGSALGADGTSSESELADAPTPSPVPTVGIVVRVPGSAPSGESSRAQPTVAAETPENQPSAGSADATADPPPPTESPRGAASTGTAGASDQTRAPADSSRSATPTPASAATTPAATSPAAADPDGSTGAPTTDTQASTTPVPASPTRGPVVVAAANGEEPTAAPTHPPAPATPAPVLPASSPTLAIASPTPLTVVEAPVARSEPTPVPPVAAAAAPTRIPAPAEPTVAPADPTPLAVTREPAIAATSPSVAPSAEPSAQPAQPRTRSGIRPAAVCEVAMLPVLAATLAGDPATAASLGCPVSPAYAATVKTQVMRAGWLIDLGGPGPIYAIFAAGWWQGLIAASVADVLTAGSPAQLGAPQGPILTSQGFVQSFEGGTALIGADGSIFVLLPDGRARAYVR